MKEYDLVVVGTGSAMNLVDPMIRGNPDIRIAVIDKDEPGGICLTRGCIPSKLLLYPAELVRSLEDGKELGVSASIAVDFPFIMQRMRRLIGADINSIRDGLSSSANIDYYHSTAEFVSPYTMRVSGDEIHGKMFFLCTGSRPALPDVKGLEKCSYLTSDTVLALTALPESLLIVGGGYIAAEYGHFFAAMGTKVTILGRNPQFLPDEEPEVSKVVRKGLEKHMRIITDCEVTEVVDSGTKKIVTARDRATGKSMTMEAQFIMYASGREATSDILHPERAGIQTEDGGWISVNEYLQTTQPNVWAFGDANGKHLFKHVANYESQVVYYNAVLKQNVKADYHAVPHAVFTYPEVAAVGMREREALESYDPEDILIGFYQYQNTAKGEAMDARDYFVKVILQGSTMKILGAHIVGPHASVLIQEVVNVMYSPGESGETVSKAMHIHPALSEVVERAFTALYPPEQYHHMLMHAGLEEGAEHHHH
ncbi:MAG: dihydrolipoyl dehydrogenase [Nitrososphaerota archaeon]|nr:dihydrolipoyl dehydrogenase [Nitrososphaerota archaeon]